MTSPQLFALGVGIDSSESTTGAKIYSRNIDDIKAKSKEAEDATGRVRVSMGGLSESIRESAAVIGSFLAIEQLVKYTDQWENLTNTLRRVTSSQQDLSAAQQVVLSISQATRSDLAATGDLYERLLHTSQGLGYSQQQLAQVTTTVNQAIALTADGSAASSGAITQLARSLELGTLQGRNFVGVLNQSPALAEAIAQGMGKSVGELRDLANAGMITSQNVIQALLNQKDEVAKAYGDIGLTVGSAFTKITNALAAYVGGASEGIGISHALAAVLSEIADHFSAVANIAVAAGAAYVARAIGPMMSSVGDFIARQGQMITGSVMAAEAELAVAAAATARAEATAVEATSLERSLALEQLNVQAILAEEGSLTELAVAMNLVAERQAVLDVATGEAAVAANAAAAANARLAEAEAATGVAGTAAAGGMGLLEGAMAIVGGPIGAAIIGIAAAIALIGHEAKDTTSSLDAIVPHVSDVTSHVKGFMQDLEAQSPVKIAIEVENVDKVKADIQQVTDALQRAQAPSGTVAATGAGFGDGSAGRDAGFPDTAADKFNADLEQIKANLVSGKTSLADFETALKGLTAQFPQFHDQAAHVDELAVKLDLLNGILHGPTPADPMGMGTLNKTLDPGIQKLNESRDAANALYAAITTGGEAGYKAEVIHQKALSEGVAAWDAYRTAAKESVDQSLSFADAVAQGNPVALQHMSILEGTAKTLEKVALAETNLRAGEKARADLAAAALTGEEEYQKSIGDVTGALATQLQIEDATIEAKNRALGTSGALTAEQVASANATEKATAALHNHNAVLQATFTQENQVSDGYAQISELGAQLSGTQAQADAVRLKNSQAAALTTFQQTVSLGGLNMASATELAIILLVRGALEQQIQKRKELAEQFTDQNALQQLINDGAALEAQLIGSGVDAIKLEVDQRYRAAQAALDQALALGTLEKASYDAQTAQLAANHTTEETVAAQKDLVAAVNTGLTSMVSAFQTFEQSILQGESGALDAFGKNALHAATSLFTQLQEKSILQALTGSDDDASIDAMLKKLGDKVIAWAEGVQQTIGKGASGAIAGIAGDSTMDGAAAGAVPLGAPTGMAANLSAIAGPALAVTAAVGLIGSAIDVFGNGAAAQAAKIATAQASFQVSLDSWTDSITGASAALKVAADATNADATNRKSQAITTAGFDPTDKDAYNVGGGGNALQQAGITPQSLLTATNAQLEVDRALADKYHELTPAVATLIDQLEQINDNAQRITGDNLAQWIRGITAAFQASLPGIGPTLTSIVASVTQMQDGIAAAITNGQFDQIPVIIATESNQLTAIFKGLTAAQLDALASSGQLSGDLLEQAKAADTAAHATEDLAATQRNNTAIGGLNSRLAGATSDPATSAQYTAEARLQAEQDEQRKASDQLAADLAAHAGDAVIAQDNYVIALTKSTEAAEDAKTVADAQAAAVKLATDQATSQTNSHLRISTANGDAAGIKEYSDLAEKEKEASDKAAALANGFDDVTAGMIVTADQAEYTAATMKTASDNAATSAAYNADLITRAANLSGDAEQIRYANLNKLQVDQAAEMAKWQDELSAGIITRDQYNKGIAEQSVEIQSALNSFDGTIGGLTTSLNDAAVAAQTLADNASQITQQAHVFGEDAGAQLTEFEKIYGFLGTSISSAQAFYTKITPGTELTDSQKATNDIIDKFVTLYENANPAPADVTSAPISTASLGSTAAAATYGPTVPVINGPNYFNVTINGNQDTVANGSTIAAAFIKDVDAALMRRANLGKSASGKL